MSLNRASAPDSLTRDELRDIWRLLAGDEQAAGLGMLAREDADELFLSLPSQAQADLILLLPPQQQKSFIRLLAPDDAADLIQQVLREAQQQGLLDLLDDRTRAEVTGLLRYEEDAAGGLMNPRYVRLRPDMTDQEAISYIRHQARDTAETIYVAYVLDPEQHLLGVVSLRQLFEAKSDAPVQTFMERRVVSVREDAPQQEVSRVFADHDLNVVPVVDSQGRMKGIVTVDDIVDVVQEEATQDIQRLGGMENLSQPYLQVTMLGMLKKRAGWLVALFVSEMLTATALGYYEGEIEKAVVLSLFITLINSAGGNSGSQSTALIVRAIGLGEVRLRDWGIVFKREIISGLSLGLLLGFIGWLRVTMWGTVFHMYGPHYRLVALAIGLTLICVVAWGTLSGAMLPFLISRCGFDPATASAPFVATFVDVTAIVIYFQISKMLLTGFLL